MSGILLRGARVITIATGRPDAERLDILVQDHRIADIGEHLDRPDAETVDLVGRIIIPGLVNAYLHTWQTGLRGVATDSTLLQYFSCVHLNLSRHCSPDDIHIATLAGALNQINCGTTTLVDWCHNSRTPEHTDAAVEALQDSGIRAVFLHGNLHLAADVAHPLTEIDPLLVPGPYPGAARCRDGHQGATIIGPTWSPSMPARSTYGLHTTRSPRRCKPTSPTSKRS